MELSKEQLIVYDKYIAGHNIFITGPGGTGKTAIIRLIYKQAIISGQDIAVCALTGCAALLLGCNAKTIHSWAGIGIGSGTIEENVNKIVKSYFKKKNWKAADVLIVDEVSMMSMKMFNMLNEIGKKVRNNPRPFGGIQVIFSGDFYQLPPVSRTGDDPETAKFCFESEDWNTVFKPHNQIELVKIFRQSDEKYSNILNMIRKGEITQETSNILNLQINKEKPQDLFIEPTKLYPRRSQVEEINKTRMDELNDSDEKTFQMTYLQNLPITEKEISVRNQYSVEDVEYEINYMKNNLLCDEIIKVKVGAQIMCIINADFPITSSTSSIATNINGTITLCNGSQGVISRFTNTNPTYPIVRIYDNNNVEKEVIISPNIWKSEKIPGVGISQIPIILAWALTIHKAQGSTIDYAEIDIGSNIFEDGQTYVALSRVKSLQGLYLTAFDKSRIRANEKVKTYYDGLKEKESTSILFESNNNKNHVKEETKEVNEVKVEEKEVNEVKEVKVEEKVTRPRRRKKQDLDAASLENSQTMTPIKTPKNKKNNKKSILVNDDINPFQEYEYIKKTKD